MVKQVIQKATGTELAAKFISKRLSSIEPAENEFALLQGLQHLHLVSALDTYEITSNYIIILKMYIIYSFHKQYFFVSNLILYRIEMMSCKLTKSLCTPTLSLSSTLGRNLFNETLINLYLLTVV